MTPLQYATSTAYRDPGYGVLYNCVNLCYCPLFSTELDSQIHIGVLIGVHYRTEIHKFISLSKSYKARFTKFRAGEQFVKRDRGYLLFCVKPLSMRESISGSFHVYVNAAF